MHLRQRPVSSSKPLPSPSLENFPLPPGGETPAHKSSSKLSLGHNLRPDSSSPAEARLRGPAPRKRAGGHIKEGPRGASSHPPGSLCILIFPSSNLPETVGRMWGSGPPPTSSGLCTQVPGPRTQPEPRHPARGLRLPVPRIALCLPDPLWAPGRVLDGSCWGGHHASTKMPSGSGPLCSWGLNGLPFQRRTFS